MLSICLILIILELIVAEHQRTITYNHDNIISISSVLGTRLIFNVEILDELISNDDPKTIVWYKGSNDLKPLINFTGLLADVTVPIHSRYHLVNRTKLIIEQTSIGDEGFYTLKIQIKTNVYKQYLYHVGFI
jgi:hypothetical protein